MKRQMIMKVSVEVRSGSARFRVGVWAPSISEALSLVGGKHPQREVRVVFPAEREGFFVTQRVTPAGIAGAELAHQEAA